MMQPKIMPPSQTAQTCNCSTCCPLARMRCHRGASSSSRKSMGNSESLQMLLKTRQGNHNVGIYRLLWRAFLNDRDCK